MVIPVPHRAQRANVVNYDRDATVYVWLHGGYVHAYFDLLPSAWKFYTGPGAWRCQPVAGTEIAATRVLDPDGTPFMDGEFFESREFLIEFPPEVDTSRPMQVTLHADTIQGFYLTPLAEAEMNMFDPSTEQAIRDIVEDFIVSHTDHLYRYFDIKTNDETGATAWFYESKVPPAEIMSRWGCENGTEEKRFRFEESEGLLFDRELFRDVKPWVKNP